MKDSALQDNFAAELRIAREQLETNRPADADQTFRDILNVDPAHPAASFGLGMLLQRAGAHQTAVEYLQTAVLAWPQHLEARFFLAVSLHGLQRLEESAEQYETVIRDHPKVAEAHNNLGVVKTELRLGDTVEQHYINAVTLKPSFAEAHKNLGALYREEGRIDKALEHLRKAIASQPHFAEAYWQLAGIVTFREHDDDIRAIELSHSREEATDEEKMKLAYALGKAFHDLRQYSRAFRYWREGNSLRRRQSGYDVGRTLNEMREMKRVFSTSFCTPADRTRATAPTLLFIVGMPRSGTTLTEQILASHSAVYGAGELGFETIVRNAVSRFPADLGNLPPAGWEAIRERYLDEMSVRAGNASCVSDKLPTNFLYIGVISRLFPDAKIIHCRRNALDTGLSCFRNHFTSDRLGFTCDLTDLGHYYRHYLDLMAHWSQVPTASLYDIHYESLVTEPEHEVRRLLEFCELRYEPDCLAFHKNKRSVKTASAVQVRQPIYRDSLEIWKHYEHELQPFKAALERRPRHLSHYLSDIFSRFRGS